MGILRTRNKITDFFMILAWASPFNGKHVRIYCVVSMLPRSHALCWFNAGPLSAALTKL